MEKSSKKLIINADDFGFSSSINNAIEKCCIEGSITGVSIMSPGRCFAQAADILRKLKKKNVGVHLTLTGELCPVASDRSKIQSLAGMNGLLFSNYTALGKKVFLGKINPDEVYIELKAQIEKVIGEGFTITHIDSHEHVHMFPVVFREVLKLAAEYHIPYVRLPIESAQVIADKFALRDLFRFTALRSISFIPQRIASKSNLACNDFFLGHFHSGRLDEDIFINMLKNIKMGLTEIAFHPAIFSGEFASEFPWYKNSQEEFKILLDEKWKKKIEELGIKLVTHLQAVE